MGIISKDPIGFNAGDANLYRYVGNQPTSYLALDGLQGHRGDFRQKQQAEARQAYRDRQARLLAQHQAHHAAIHDYKLRLLAERGVSRMHGTQRRSAINSINATARARFGPSELDQIRDGYAQRAVMLVLPGMGTVRAIKDFSEGRYGLAALNVASEIPWLKLLKAGKTGGRVASVSPNRGFTGQFGKLDPNDIRFSQTTAGGRGRAAQLRESMRNGWNGPAVDAVRTPDGIVTIDNTRIAIARELGIPEVPVKIRLPSDPIATMCRSNEANTLSCTSRGVESLNQIRAGPIRESSRRLIHGPMNV